MTWPHALPNPARTGTAIALACLLAFATPAVAVASSKPHHHQGSKRSGPEPGPPTTPDRTPTTPDTTPYTPPEATAPVAPAPVIAAPAPAPAPATHKAATKHKPRPKKHRHAKKHHHAKLAAHKPKPPPAPKAAAKPVSNSIVGQSPNALSLAVIPIVLLVLAAALAATAIGTKVIRSRRLAAGDPEAYASEYDTPAHGFEAVSPPAIKGERLPLYGERMRLYGERMRVAVAERGVELAIVGVGLAAAIALGALVGGM